MKTQPYMRPLRQPVEEVYVSYKDGDVFIYKPRRYEPDPVTRLCLPADYANNYLAHFNQKNSKNLGNPWTPTSHSDGALIGRIAQILINSGTGVRIWRGNYSWGATKLFGAQGANNWSLDKTNKKFSFEFYINNNLKDVSDVQINSCDSLTDWSGSANVALSIDTVDFKEGTGSLQIVATVGAGGGYESAEYAPATTMNLSDKEFLKVYVKSDDITDVRIYIDLWSATGYFSRWLITPSTTNTWERDPWVLPLRKPDEIGYNGEVDLSAVDRISIYIFNDSEASKTITVKVDDISKDVGQWVKVEVYVPDVPLADAGDGWSTRLFSWDILTGAWKTTPFIKWAIDGGSAVYGTTWLMFLDGTDDAQIWDDIKKGVSAFDVGERGDIKPALGGGFASEITYSSYYGCKKRIGFAIKMPPDDGQDSATSGISQCKLKIEIYYDDNGKTTYEFEKSTNQYYGLDNINDSWLALFNPTKNLSEYLILNRRPLGLEVIADHNEDIHEIKFKLKKGTRIWLGELIHEDHQRDSNGDGVPDIFEEDYDPSIALDMDFNNEDETQNIAHDRSPNHNNGTIYGASWVDGKVGRALSFLDAYLEIADDATLNFSADESFSVSLWFKLSSLPSTALYAILSKYGAGQGAGLNDLYALYIDTDGKIRFSIRDSAGNNPVIIGSALTVNSWYHVVGVRDTKKDEIRLYLNGVLDVTPVTDTTVDDISSPRPLLIGNQEHYIAGEPPTLPFHGVIDEICIFKGRTLGTDEIQELYNLGKLKRVSVPRLVKKMGYAGW